jgi:hypothetical protein
MTEFESPLSRLKEICATCLRRQDGGETIGRQSSQCPLCAPKFIEFGDESKGFRRVWILAT